MAAGQTTTRQGIHLTDETVHMLKLFARNAQKAHWGIKLADEVSICGEGYNYVLDLVSAPEEHDVVFHCKGVEIYVPEQSLKRLAGSEIEYHDHHHDASKDSFKKSFHVKNPNAKGLCPCGCGDGAGY
jgi:iron-sulfur cluster assembly accessory protein